MNKLFRRGFCKTAAHVLAELSYNNDDSEYQQKRQAILEASYQSEKDRETADYYDKEQRDTKKVVKQENPQGVSPGHERLMERS